MTTSIFSPRTEVEVDRTRVLLAVDSTQYAQILSKCLADEAPDFQLMFFTDEEGKTLDSSDIVDLLTTIAKCEPDVMVHASDGTEPNTDLYGWVFGQFPFLPIVHVNTDGRIRRFRQAISMDDFSNQAEESSSRDAISQLLKAIRASIEREGQSASIDGVSDEVVSYLGTLTQFPNS